MRTDFALSILLEVAMVRYRVYFRCGPLGSPCIGVVIHTAGDSLIAAGIAWDRLQRMLGRNNKGDVWSTVVLDRVEVLS